jgi:hypothetical protein
VVRVEVDGVELAGLAIADIGQLGTTRGEPDELVPDCEDFHPAAGPQVCEHALPHGGPLLGSEPVEVVVGHDAPVSGLPRPHDDGADGVGIVDARIPNDVLHGEPPPYAATLAMRRRGQSRTRHTERRQGAAAAAQQHPRIRVASHFNAKSQITAGSERSESRRKDVPRLLAGVPASGPGQLARLHDPPPLPSLHSWVARSSSRSSGPTGQERRAASSPAISGVISTQLIEPVSTWSERQKPRFPTDALGKVVAGPMGAQAAPYLSGGSLDP